MTNPSVNATTAVLATPEILQDGFEQPAGNSIL